MTDSFLLGRLQAQEVSEMEALVMVGPEMVALVSEAMVELVACNKSGRATCHHPEDNESRWQGQLPNILHMRLFLL
jgi:hypothetical protein